MRDRKTRADLFPISNFLQYALQYRVQLVQCSKNNSSNRVLPCIVATGHPSDPTMGSKLKSRAQVIDRSGDHQRLERKSESSRIATPLHQFGAQCPWPPRIVAERSRGLKRTGGTFVSDNRTACTSALSTAHFAGGGRGRTPSSNAATLANVGVGALMLHSAQCTQYGSRTVQTTVQTTDYRLQYSTVACREYSIVDCTL
jgi:hypothetical protein